MPVPPDVAAEVGGVVDEARRGLSDQARRIRWVQLDGLHVTLRFLGPTPATRVVEVAGALDAASVGIEPFEVRFAGAGAFPARERPRALWLGIVRGVAELGRLAAAFEAALSAAGWPVEPRSFRPHLTVARTDGVNEGTAAAAALERAAATLDVGFRADRVLLYRSHLGTGPAKYESLYETSLAGP